MGEIMAPSFINEFQFLIETWFPEAFFAGMAACGVMIDNINELEMEERQIIWGNMITDLTAIVNFAADIETGRYGESSTFAGVGPRSAVFNSLYSRIDLYTNRLNRFYDLGQQAGCANRMMRWELGRTREHCVDCAYYNGQVHRMRTWESYGALPRTGGLECGGFRCDCQLVQTTERATGRLRNPTGGR